MFKKFKKRQRLRLPEYDYAKAKYYFVTVCVNGRGVLLGDITDGVMILNDAGLLVEQIWSRLPQRFQNIELNAFVVMPNHIHGVIYIRDAGCTLGDVMGFFKHQTAKYINALHQMPGRSVWQRNYFDRILRDGVEHERIREYIVNNPRRWAKGKVNPRRVG